MIIGTVARMAAGALALGILSTCIPVAALRGFMVSGNAAWDAGGSVLMFGLTVSALVWSTALAQRHALPAWSTGAVALVIGVGVLFSAALFADLLYPPAWRTLGAAGHEPTTTLHDVRWIGAKLAECAVYVLPFAAWRGLRRRRPILARATA